MVPCFLIMMLVPKLLPRFHHLPGHQFHRASRHCCVLDMLFLIVHIDGKPLLNFKEVACIASLIQSIFFMIAAAVYGANTPV